MGKHQYSGFPGDCSEEQLQVLEQFRKEVREMGCNDPPYDDAYLLRFLRARKFDLKKTKLMFTNYINWRKEENVDDAYNFVYEELNEVKACYPHAYFRTDKIGRPVFYERVGQLKYHEMMKITTAERFRRYFIKEYEDLFHDIFPACSKAAGKRIDQTVYVMDLKGGALKLLSPKIYDFIKSLMKIGSDYYPEILGKMFIINAPMLFYGVWGMLKPFVDERTRNKISILGTNYEKELLEVIGEENLPDIYGGKATVEDYGENFSNNQGPWVVKIEPKKEEEIPMISNKSDTTASEKKSDPVPVESSQFTPAITKEEHKEVAASNTSTLKDYDPNEAHKFWAQYELYNPTLLLKRIQEMTEEPTIEPDEHTINDIRSVNAQSMVLWKSKVVKA